MLLRKVNGPRRLVSELHAQRAASGRDAQILVAHATDDVEGLPRRLLERQPQRVRVHRLLHRGSHVWRRLEESIGRHEPLDSLMRPLEVIRVDVQPKAPLAVGVVAEDRPAQELLPERLPESLHLAQRLRMLRTALDVRDPLAPQLLLEVRLPAPCCVLAPLIGQDLTRRPPGRDAALQRFHHEARALVVRHRPAHEEARVVVHEGGHVETLVTPEQKREDVRLPHLIRRCALEAPRPVLPRRRRRRRLRDETLLVQDAAHFRLAHPQRLEAGEHVADAACAPLGVLASFRDHGVVLHLSPEAPGTLRRMPLLRHQRVLPSSLVRSHPVLDRRHARSEDRGDPPKRDVSTQRFLHHPQPNGQRVCLATTADIRQALSPSSSLRRHRHLSFHGLRCPFSKGGWC